MVEISSTRATPPSPPLRPSVGSVELAVRLLQPLDQLLEAGQTAKAEVLQLREAANSFQLVLRLQLDNGQSSTLQAQSSRPLPIGEQVLLTALSATQASLRPQGAASQALQQLDLHLLPTGSLLQGKVLDSQSQLDAQGRQQFRIVLSLLNTPLAGRQLLIDSPQPLPNGSLLTAQVQGSQQLLFLPLSQQLDQLAVQQQLQGQLANQASLQPLLKALPALLQAKGLPEGVQQSLRQLFAGLPELEQLSHPKQLAQAMENAGSLLENRLLSGQLGTLPHDFKANLLRLLGQLLPHSPQQALAQAFSLGQGQGQGSQALPAFFRQALGALGQSGTRQPAGFPLPTRLLQDMEGEADLETLLKLAAAAVSRLQSHQLASLAQNQTLPDGTQLTTWQMELPVRQQQDIVPVQVRVQHEEPDQASERESLWRLDLAFDLPPLGALQVQAQLLRGTLSSQLWAEQASTAALIDQELEHLRQRLKGAGLQVGELACRHGMPAQGPSTQLSHRWVDETA